MVGKPGGQFHYGSYHLCAFAEALQRRLKSKTGETFEKYMERRILQPLGIKLEWRIRCADGNPQVGGGGFMTARDWATFGEFMRQGGTWNGKQIISKELLAECLQGTKQNPAYGLTVVVEKASARLHHSPNPYSPIRNGRDTAVGLATE